MKQLIYTLCLCLLCRGVSHAQEYAAANIPETLKENADAVIRDQQTLIHIKAIDNIVYTERTAITILNGEGLDYAQLRLHYNKLIKPGKIKGYLYNKNGDEIRKAKNSEITDVAIYGQSFTDDHRIKGIDFHYAGYPFTVVYETETVLSSLFLIDSWEPQSSDNISIEKASLEIISPKNITLNLRTFQTVNKPATIEDGGNRITTFTLENVAAKEDDELEGFELFPHPILSISPETLTLGEISGSMKTWQSFGKFYADLNKGRSTLPDKTKTLVHTLTDTCTSIPSKISLLYEHLKKSTRYVSIQLGIGGWQTLTAQHVAEKGYGDCKALTNYMKALLQEAGITAHEALVLAGRGKHVTMPEGYVNNRFNHVILCVPGKNDTTWLECTANTLPSGYLSDFTADRDVLVVTPAGGFIAHTPVYNSKQNYIHRNVVAHLTENGDLQGNVITVYSGSEYDKEHYYYYEQSPDKIRKHLGNKFTIASYSVGEYHAATSSSHHIPALTVNVEVSGTGNVQKSGERLFISPVVIAVTDEDMPRSIKRDKPFHIGRSYAVSDTTIMIIDNGTYTAENIPEDVNHSYTFGNFSSTFSFENDNTIKYIRYFELKEGSYTPSMYSDYKKLLKEATITNPKVQAVLLKKQ